MTLLIVDDEIYAIQGLLKVIDKKQTGIDRIVTANCYSQAVNIYMEQTVDLMLCDIEMPFGSGLDLVEWVNENSPFTVNILLTCHSEFDFARQAISLNCFDYLLKPVMPETINETLKKAAKHWKAQKEDDLYKKYGRAWLSSMSGEKEDSVESKDVTEQAEQYIMTHLNEELNLTVLSEAVHVSVTHLNRLFKQKKNTTVNDFITGTRMKAAKTLLDETNLTITDVAEKTGYGNYSYFIKIFKKTYGITPREYRKKKNG